MADSQPEDPVAIRNSSSQDNLTTASTRPISQPKRQASVHFSDSTNPVSRSPMSSQQRLSTSDEVTPIRLAEGAPGRSYNTNDVDDATAATATGTSSTKKAASRSPEPEQGEEKAAWFKRIAEKYGSITLENKGSVARDHLALERTFLAWLRTALAFASIGIAITQLFRLNTNIASHSKDFSFSASTSGQAQSELPFSPLVGQSLPVELLPFLQQALASAAASAPALGPTLLDQLLLLPPPGGENPTLPFPPTYRGAQFNEDAAAKLRHMGKPLGATFLGISIIILLIGFHRYFESQHWIIRGKFPASRGSIFFVGFIAGALIIASLVVVLVVAPTTFQKR